MHAQSLSCVQLIVNPWTIDHQAYLSKGFPGKNTGVGCHFPPPGDIPNPGFKPTSPESPELAGRFFTTEPLGKPHSLYTLADT